MKNLGVAIAGAGGKRRALDFYPTPTEATVALLASGAIDKFPSVIWEPACGDGAISKVLKENHFQVVSTDLEDHGFVEGTSDMDFLACDSLLASAIITNPPFALADKFIRKARALGVEHLALLLKATYFHTAKRVALFDLWRPSRECKFTWRLDFTGGGAPTMDCSWWVWTPGDRSCQVELLRKPEVTTKATTLAWPRLWR